MTKLAGLIPLNFGQGVPWHSSGWLPACIAGGAVWIPCQGTKIPQATRCGQKKIFFW